MRKTKLYGDDMWYTKPLASRINIEWGEPNYEKIAPTFRLYPPCRRTIKVRGLKRGLRIKGSNYVNLPLPYLIFGSKKYSGGKVLVHAMSLVSPVTKQTIVYPSPLNSLGMIVCVDTKRHVIHPRNTTLDELISTFWATEFWYGPLRYATEGVFKTIKEWESLDTNGFSQRFKSMRSTIKKRGRPFEDLLGKYFSG